MPANHCRRSGERDSDLSQAVVPGSDFEKRDVWQAVLPPVIQESKENRRRHDERDLVF